jgi:leucyl aminopeptidase
MALASSQFGASYVPHQLMATAFSVNVQQARAGYSSTTSTQRAMSKMDQSFKTWSFDEPCTTMAWSELSTASLASATTSDNWDDDADLVVVGVFAPKKEDEDEEESEDKEEEEPTVTLTGGAKDLDEKLGGALSNAMLENAKAFNHGAEAGSVTPTLRVFRDGKSQRFAVIGLGIAPRGDDDGISGVGSAVGKALATMCDSEKKVKSAKVLLPESVGSDTDILKAMSATFYTTLYADNRYRTGKKVKKSAEDLETLTLVSEGSSTDGAEGALEAGKKLAAGIFMTKDIVNSPHNVLNSLSLAETAKRIAEESGGVLKCTILGKEECEERGMGAYLGVARGSETPPQFIHLTYTPPDGKVNKKVGIVGKGLLFDTGGYNIKTQGMLLMKFDCGGAAAVLGTLKRLTKD